jgi:hypothetical protein
LFSSGSLHPPDPTREVGRVYFRWGVVGAVEPFVHFRPGGIDNTLRLAPRRAVIERIGGLRFKRIHSGPVGFLLNGRAGGTPRVYLRLL